MAPKEEKGKGKVPSETLRTLFLRRLCKMTAESSVASSNVPLVPTEQPGLFQAPPPSEAKTTTPSVGSSAGRSGRARETPVLEERRRRGVFEAVVLTAKRKVATAVGKVPKPACELSAVEEEFVEAAHWCTFLQHWKDREEVPICLGVLGTYCGLQDLALNRSWRRGRLPAFPPSEVQREKAHRAKKKAAGAVRDEIAKLTRLLEEVVTDEGEEFAEVMRGEEEEETEEELEGEDLEGWDGPFGPFGGFGGAG
ncbi:uncharacterized protein SPPG_08462 [Spizellomyces punctatus DAOM BR117]|uniref:Uncharacterized protein n=1 Tax=Spizellomyces punctatus (strain DAOM BR117) TaxID=645134 RepID=A0A0L0H5A5_SPIPD|nr:uncharacterized protein SPPG_08462 [Spizellomyces punctatus DAOM BR117]KNC96071.1 hypothetical protein SPPG_08462 [Spizellomyces punctatus DAOM BR117]|eukprot:XP_016604111.1 hypothetical protein SPPG_08462 [Spizellomyces punctatus DAOM BR117]